MIFLLISGIILALLLLILFLPVEIFISFKEAFKVKIKFFGIKVFEIEPESQEKNDKALDKVSEKNAQKDTENKAKKIFSRLKERLGFTGAVKEIFKLLLDCLTHIKSLLRHIKINKIRLNIAVASDDAAKTAIEYGTVCSAVYPVLALLDTVPNIGLKEINIRSDFEGSECDFSFSLQIGIQIFFALISAFKIYKEYRNFVIRNEENERK